MTPAMAASLAESTIARVLSILFAKRLACTIGSNSMFPRECLPELVHMQSGIRSSTSRLLLQWSQILVNDAVDAM